MPLGPRVVFTKSAIAIAPTKDCYKTRHQVSIMLFHSIGWKDEKSRGNPPDCGICKPSILKRAQEWRTQITYKSSDFTSVLGGTFHENLGQHVLKQAQEKSETEQIARIKGVLTPTMSISVEAIALIVLL